METIAIDTSTNLNLPNKNKKDAKNKANTANGTIITGVVGSVAGAVVLDAIDNFNEADADADFVGEAPSPVQEQTSVEEEVVNVEEPVVEVNPDEVMLVEETQHMAEEVAVETDSHEFSTDDYQPFANNDRIDVESETLLEPDDILLADEQSPEIFYNVNSEDDLLADDSVVDLIVGDDLSEDLVADQQLPYDDEIISEPICPQDDLTAEVDTFDNATDIQSDLMA